PLVLCYLSCRNHNKYTTLVALLHSLSEKYGLAQEVEGRAPLEPVQQNDLDELKRLTEPKP
ncbi:hypothetical protein, partial [Desulfoprunum benzoelyticum]|uniref:hypothetical protein n=1 Tax=Desulfoprunum benzoelyticum TaxID=1506996 RepID=UPI001C85D3AC